jgi:hypothetical protein
MGLLFHRLPKLLLLLMKFRTFITPLAVVGGLFFVVGLALLGNLLLRNPLGLIEQGGLQNPTALQFVPKQSTVVASLLARPDRLADVWEFLAAPELRQQARQDIEQIEQTLLADTGLDYEQDILPWLGEDITAAIVSSDIDQNLDNGVEPGYLVALSCQDGQAARAMLELFWQNRAIAGDALSFEDFAGSRLIYSTPGHRENDANPRLPTPLRLGRLASTLVADRFVLIANHPEVLRQALNAAQSLDNNLASDQRYRRALQALPTPRVGLVALHLPKATSLLWGIPQEAMVTPSLTSVEEPENALTWGLISLGLTREGIVADMAWTATPGHRFEPREAQITGFPKTAYYLPTQIAVTAIGQSLQALQAGVQPLWQRYRSGADDDFWGQVELLSVLDQEVVQAFLHTVTKDFALGFNLNQMADWLLVSQQNEALAGVLQRVYTSAQQAGIGVSTLMMNDHPTTALARLTLSPDLAGAQTAVTAQVLGLQMQINDMNVMSSSADLMASVLKQKQPEQAQHDLPLPSWAQDLSLFQNPNEGYIHLQWPQLQSELSQRSARFRLWQTTAKPILRHLQTITLSSYGSSRDLQTGRVFVRLSN